MSSRLCINLLIPGRFANPWHFSSGRRISEIIVRFSFSAKNTILVHRATCIYKIRPYFCLLICKWTKDPSPSKKLCTYSTSTMYIKLSSRNLYFGGCESLWTIVRSCKSDRTKSDMAVKNQVKSKIRYTWEICQPLTF